MSGWSTHKTIGSTWRQFGDLEAHITQPGGPSFPFQLVILRGDDGVLSAEIPAGRVEAAECLAEAYVVLLDPRNGDGVRGLRVPCFCCGCGRYEVCRAVAATHQETLCVACEDEEEEEDDGPRALEDDPDFSRGTSECDGLCDPMCDWCLVGHVCPDECGGGDDCPYVALEAEG